MTLSGIVIGAGWAGEGHTFALRAAGVDVLAMCGRTSEPAIAMAEKLAIPQVRFDWLSALEEFRPDIVAIATPAGPHCAIAQAAARRGCHILCDKPMGINAAEARVMLLAVEQAGVKHAYAANSCYAPAIRYSRTLLAQGLIGQVTEIESSVHLYLSPLTISNWLHQRDQGGGLLNNVFTHKIGQVRRLTGGQVRAAAGEARQLIDRAPVGPSVHDFREVFGPNAVLSEAQARVSEWRPVDADMGYTVMLKIEMPAGYTVSALFQASAMAVSPYPDSLCLYGTQGALCLTGPNAPDRIQHLDHTAQAWVDLPVPLEIAEAFPQIEDPVQRDWNQIFREFVADVRGEGYAGYPTFRDGWVDSEIVDIARSGHSWTSLPEHP